MMEKGRRYLSATKLSIEDIQKAVTPIAEKYGVERVYLFGSYARGDAREDSDIDLRTEGGDTRGPWMSNLFQRDVQDALGMKVDATETTAHHQGTVFLARIRGDEVLLYEQGQRLSAPIFIPIELRRSSYLSTEQRDVIYLKRTITFCNDVAKAIDFFGKDFNAFEDNSIFRHAVCMAIFQAGEIAGKLSENFRSSNPQMPWVSMKAMRNVLAHEYYHANHQTIWIVATQHVPELAEHCRRVLNEIEPKGE